MGTSSFPGVGLTTGAGMNDHSAMSSDYTTRLHTPVKHEANGHSSDKREAILSAALDLFAERTYDGTPMPLVAQRAGVGAGTIYRYFRNKEALVNAVYRRCMEGQRRLLIDDVPVEATAREQFHHWWRGMCEFATANPQGFVFLETHHHESYRDAESQALLDQVRAGAHALVENAQARGEVRQTTPDVLISLVFGAFTGLVKSTIDGDCGLAEETVSQAEECVWQMLRP